jgi:hypothetical protein
MKKKCLDLITPPVTAELTDRWEINTPVGKADEGYSLALRLPSA